MSNAKQRLSKAGVLRLEAALSVALLITVLTWTWMGFFSRGAPYSFFDIDYYRNAVIDVARGTKSMYEALPYPPFAFLVVSFLGGLPPMAGNEIWTAGTLLVLLVVALVLAQQVLQVRGVGWRMDPWGLILRSSVSAALLLYTLPLSDQLTNGQLSLVIMATSFVDAVGALPRRYRGILVGLAGAIKVTPLIFVPYFLVNRLWREATVSVGTFAAATLLGWGLFPAGSLYFWAHLGKNDVFGNPGRLDNFSIHGSLARWSSSLGQAPGLWESLGLVVMTAAMWRARRHFLRGEQMEAVLVVGASATVVAPIAWPHYFTWLPLAGLWLLMTGHRRSRLLGLGIYFAYSIWFMALFVPGFGTLISSPAAAVRRAVDILALIPVVIGLFGLPGQDSGRRLATQQSPEGALRTNAAVNGSPLSSENRAACGEDARSHADGAVPS